MKGFPMKPGLKIRSKSVLHVFKSTASTGKTRLLLFGLFLLSAAKMADAEDENMEINLIDDDEPPVDQEEIPKVSPDKNIKGGDGDSNSASKSDSPEKSCPEEALPTSLEGFKYGFNEDGQFRHLETGEPFVFKVSDDHKVNQRRYEAIGELVTLYVFELLETKGHLKKVYIPIDAKDDEPRSFFFMSEDALENPDKLLILVHGSGVVRAGQWARRLIMNDCLDSGTQLPFILRAREQGYGVIVLNTNLNSVQGKDDKDIPIRGNSRPEEHTFYVWDNFICKAAAKHMAFISHSYGGIVTTALAMQEIETFKQRVFAIAFTDSVHSLTYQDATALVDFYKTRAQNWKSSEEPLDTSIPSHFHEDCPNVSAGHPKHENTSWSSFESIFTFLAKKFEEATQTGKDSLPAEDSTRQMDSSKSAVEREKKSPDKPKSEL